MVSHKQVSHKHAFSNRFLISDCCCLIGSLEERLEAIVTKVVGPIKKALDLVIAEMLDPWERIHSETESVVGANEKSNLDPVSNYYGTKKSYYCMVLGKVTHCQIICAHIWPRLTLDKGLEAFELTCMDVNSPRNFLRLHQSIEKAFDKKRLIFVPAESMIEGETALKVVILDPTLLEEDLDYSGHTIKFSAINGRVFDYKFTCDKSPFTRLISNHALQAMNKAKTLNWIAQDDSEMVAVRTSAIELARKSLGQESYSMQAFFK